MNQDRQALIPHEALIVKTVVEVYGSDMCSDVATAQTSNTSNSLALTSSSMPVTIDAASFPHIIDSIFDLAPLDALLHLRVCREWQRRVHARLYHVTLSESTAVTTFPLTTTYVLKAAGQEGEVTFKTSPYGQAQPPAPSYLSDTAIIDLQMPTFKVDICRRVLAFAPREATYRLHEYCNLWGTGPWRPRCLVLFSKDTAPACTIAAYTTYGLNALQGCDKLVVHVWHGGLGLETLPLTSSAQLKQLKELVIVVHPNPEGEESGATTWYDIGLADLGVLGYASRVLTTFVMCKEGGNAEPAWLLQEVQEMEEIAERIAERVEYAESLGHAACSKPRVRRPLFLIEEEYKGLVGEKQYEIEMNEGTILPPPHPRQS